MKPNDKKIIIFPGMVERLIENAHKYISESDFQAAVENFEEAFQYTEPNAMSLHMYAYGLFELRQYERAQEICEEIIQCEPLISFEVMELYVAICIELRQFKKVEKLIDELITNDEVPQDQIEQFERLRKLNADLAEKQEDEESDEGLDNREVDRAFLDLTVSEQFFEIRKLEGKNIRPYVSFLKDIIQHADVQPYIKSLALVLLVEQQVDDAVTVYKFGREEIVNPTSLLLPNALPMYKNIKQYLEERLEQDPTMLEMVEFLLAKHSLVTYPFEWLDYEVEDVALGYIHYVQAMMGQVLEADYELFDFIQELEKYTDFS